MIAEAQTGMNKNDSCLANVEWIERPTMDAYHEPRRGEIWVAQRHQQFGITPAGVICSFHTAFATHMQSLRD